MKKSKKIKKKLKILEKKSDKMKNLKTTQNVKKNMFFNFSVKKKKFIFWEKNFRGQLFSTFLVFFFQIPSWRFCLGHLVYVIGYKTLFPLKKRK